jgi:uncharacterized membrane protein YhaH (DUF805 family)
MEDPVPHTDAAVLTTEGGGGAGGFFALLFVVAILGLFHYLAYKQGCVDQYKAVMTTKFKDFDNRARRSEYIKSTVMNMLISWDLALFLDGPLQVMTGVPVGVFSLIYSLAVFIPNIAVTVRRLHDTGRSGYFIFIALIPIVGAIFLIYLCFFADSDPETNMYGPNPKGIAYSNDMGLAGQYVPTAVQVDEGQMGSALLQQSAGVAGQISRAGELAKTSAMNAVGKNADSLV